jgi:putative transposase
LNLYLFRGLDELREIASRWIDEYNETRPHDALGGLPHCIYAIQTAENST